MTLVELAARPPLEPPILEPALELFRLDGEPGPPVCSSCGAGVEVTVMIHHSHAARWATPTHDRAVFICAGCILLAVRLLEGSP